MTQALYAHMNNKTKKIRKETHFLCKETHRLKVLNQESQSVPPVSAEITTWTSLAIKEMQIKTMLRFYLSLLEWLSSRKQTRTNVGKNVRKKELSYTVGRTIN
jgi:hypothetical protein